MYHHFGGNVMEPVSAIVLSLALGAKAAAGKAVVAEIVKDAYAQVKGIITSRFSSVPLSIVEASPESSTRRAVPRIEWSIPDGRSENPAPNRSGAYTVAYDASAGMVYRHENEYPNNPCSKIRAGPDPARKYRIRAPSRSIQHSSTPAPGDGASMVETSESAAIPTKSFNSESSQKPGQLFPRRQILSN